MKTNEQICEVNLPVGFLLPKSDVSILTQVLNFLNNKKLSFIKYILFFIPQVWCKMF